MTSMVCATCGMNRGAIFPRTQECPPCKAKRIGHCLCRACMNHKDQCLSPADPVLDDGQCRPCHNFWESIAHDN